MILLNLLIHVGCWTQGHVSDAGWHGAIGHILSVPFLGAGFIGFIIGIVQFLTSLQIIRRWKYEVFLSLHIILGSGFLLAGAAHCYFHPPPMPQLWFIVAALCVFVVDRLCRYLTQLYCSWSFSSGASTAIIEALPGTAKACKITMQLRRHMNIRPGTHAYIRLEAVEPWASHPFSIAWINQSAPDTLDPEKHDDGPKATTTVSFIVGVENGFTRKLHAKAKATRDAQFATRGSFEGPYGGHHSLASYGHVVLFAGATGLCHQLRYVQALVQGQRTASVSAQRVVLVWIIRECHALYWVRSWIQSLNCPPEFLEIKIFVTRDRVVPRGMWINHDLPRFVSIMSGRPSVDVIVGTEVQEQVGAMCVGVCGPVALADDVRAAVRVAQDTGREIDFVEESFSW
jgi:predicted ferric reductase